LSALKFSCHTFCDYWKKYKPVKNVAFFEGISMGILGRVFMAKRSASFTALFNDMNKTKYGGAVRFVDDCA